MNSNYQEFYRYLWNYYHASGRHDLPWRQAEPSKSLDPYHILVSEIMLQQTQVTRVIPKYKDFLTKFPTVQILAQAELGEVLRTWQGLGYNRRAKFLWQAAQEIIKVHRGVIPDTVDVLMQLPGIGKNTAGAIVVYAYNKPEIFVETNIRTVYIYHFLKNMETIDDKDIHLLIADTIDSQNPRVFYWALMDYGSYLKQTAGNFNAKSKTYIKQSAFHGSRRQIRGAVVRLLGTKGMHTYDDLHQAIHDNRLDSVLEELAAEGLITKTATSYRL